MEGLKTRLNRMKLDVKYKRHNLRDTFPIPLKTDDMEVIELLKNRTFTQKAIKPYLKNPILRDFIRHSAKTTKPYIYDTLKKQTNLLDNVSKNKQAIASYIKLMGKETPMHKSQLRPKDNQKLLRKNELRRIIIEVRKCATNEKMFCTLMQAAMYVDFTLSKKSGKVIGCGYTELGSKRTVNFTDLGLHWGEIRKSFTINVKKLENAETLTPPVLVKIVPTPQELATSKIRTKTPESIPIDYNHAKITRNKHKAKKTSQMRRTYDKLIPNIKSGIIRFKKIMSRLVERVSSITEAIGTAATRIEEDYSLRESIGFTEDDINSTKKEKSRLTSRYNDLEKDINREDKYESSTQSEISTNIMRLIESEQTQREINGGTYEDYIYAELTWQIDGDEGENQKLTTDIEERRNINRELKNEIRKIERKIAKASKPTIYSSPSSGMRP